MLDPFTIWLQLAFYFALIVTCPYWLYQVWAFIAPGLYQREKRWTYVFVFTAAPRRRAGDDSAISAPAIG